MFVLNKKNVLLGVEINDADEAIRVLGNQLVENGYIQPEYIDSVIEREKLYPTGLPTDGVHVAIPHANAKYVKRSAIGVMTLVNPVEFKNMGDAAESLDVELVFLLANADQADQPESLQRLMQCFSEEETLIKMKRAETSDEIVEVLQEFMGE